MVRAKHSQYSGLQCQDANQFATSTVTSKSLSAKGQQTLSKCLSHTGVVYLQLWLKRQCEAGTATAQLSAQREACSGQMRLQCLCK